MTDHVPAVTLSAHERDHLRFEVTLGLTAMLYSATAYCPDLAPDVNARRTAELTDIYRYIDGALTRALGAGLATYERIGPAMDTVTIGIALADARVSTTPPSSAVQ